MTDDAKSKTRLPSFWTVLFGCSVVTLVGCLAWTVMTRQRLATELTMLASERVSLQRELDSIEQSNEQWNQDKVVLKNMFGLCREVDDVPILGGDHIVSSSNNGDTVVFYVPDGEHELVLQAEWNTKGIDEATAAENGFEAGKKTWEIPLVGGQGYLVKLGSTRQRVSQPATPFTVSIESSSPDFAPRVETVPVGGFRSFGSSWSSYRIVQFPNTISVWSLTRQGGDNASAVESIGALLIGKWTKFGKVGETNIEIKLDVSIASAGPAILTALDAQTVLVIRRNLDALTYLGGGRYGLRGANDDPMLVSPDQE